MHAQKELEGEGTGRNKEQQCKGEREGRKFGDCSCLPVLWYGEDAARADLIYMFRNFLIKRTVYNAKNPRTSNSEPPINTSEVFPLFRSCSTLESVEPRGPS